MGFFQRYKLKYTNRVAYEYYKDQIRRYKYQSGLQKIVLPQFEVPKKDIYAFKHSGNSGDIIYSIPTMLGLVGNSLCNIHLRPDQPSMIDKHLSHPLGRVMLNHQIIGMLKPLLEYQTYVNECTPYENQPIDYDLDKFREYPLKLDKGNIARWNMLVYPVVYDLNNIWINAPAESSLKESIVLSRSSRYNAPGINHSFLKKIC